MLTRDEEVGGSLPVGRLVAHIDEVLARLVRRSEVHLLTLIDNANLVEVLVQLLARLVDGDDGGLPGNVRGNAERLDKLEGG